jgi:hypothetical protein
MTSKFGREKTSKKKSTDIVKLMTSKYCSLISRICCRILGFRLPPILFFKLAARALDELPVEVSTICRSKMS